MDIIKTSIGISKTIKNVGRLREILATFSKNGLDDILITTGLYTFLPNFVLPKSRKSTGKLYAENTAEEFWPVFGAKLRKSFEELGPTFIKLGQLLATREDLFNEHFILEMNKLRDKVKGPPFSKTKHILEKSLGKNTNDIFKSVQEEPIGAASIGVVYDGVLKDGTEVVIKIRKPKIKKFIEGDLAILSFLVAQAERVTSEIKYLGISKLIEDFKVSLRHEIDFRTEAKNAERLRVNLERVDTNRIFHIPLIFKEFSSEDILVMEYLKGIPFSNYHEAMKVKDVIQDKLEEGVRLFIHSLLVDGFFHADLHGGNFFLLEDHTIGLIDFGLVGSLGKKSRIHLVAILYALVNHNYDNLVYEFLDVADYDYAPDIDKLIRDVKDDLTPFVGLTAKEIDIAYLLKTVISILSKHRIYLPREWFVIFRALITLDGVGKSLDMDMDIFSVIEENIKEVVKNYLTMENTLEEVLWTAKDIFFSLRMFPRHLRWFLRDLAKNQYAFEIRNSGYEKELKRLSNSLNFIGICIVGTVFILSGSFMLKDVTVTVLNDIPTISWIFWTMGALTFMFGLRTMLRKK